MSWLIPSALGIAGIGALVAVALHFIARSRPLAEPLPTARFIPARPVRARTRSMALSDLPLLVVRVAALVAVGAAVAGPVLAARRNRIARVILLDRSRGVADVRSVIDSARASFRAGDVVIAFDSAADVVTALDSVRRVPARGSLSAGLAAALRAGSTLSRTNDSLELVIVSPMSSEEIDAATSRIRAAWPGRARVVPVAAMDVRDPVPVMATDVDETDPVIAGLSLVAERGADAWIRIVRHRVSSSDSAWAATRGHVLIHWPAGEGDATWPVRHEVDAVGAVTSESGTLISRLPRLWVLEGRAVARWIDGEPAAVERAVGDGCLRDVGILVDPTSDVTLRPAFRELVRALIAPCGGVSLGRSADSATVTMLRGPAPLATAAALRDREAESSPWTPWLLGAAAALLLIELAARRTVRSAA